MADEIDAAQAREEMDRAAAIKAAAKPLPQGEPGDCDMCGEWSGRPDCKGYAWPLSWAGKYPESEVRASLFYFNSGENVAVPCHVLDYMAIDPKPGYIDHDAGPVVPSNAANWRRLLANTIERPKLTPKPMYRGMPRARRTAGAPAND